MVRLPWQRDNPGRDTSPTHGSPPAVDNSEASTAPGSGGTWQEVLHSGEATASSGGFANTGIYTSHMHLPPDALRLPDQVDARPGLDDVQHQPHLFVGRGRELDRLDAALAAPGMALVQAVHGLGGIGKSALAAHWATTRHHGRAPIRWITADSPGSVQKGLADLATALQPALRKLDLPDPELAEWGLQWLASHTGWLIILDNVNDPADIAHLTARIRSGRFLITSRLATAWTHATTLVRLDVLEPAESLDLFTRITTANSPGRNLDGAPELCEELGHLPLAIDQAAAYLAQNPLTTPRTYLTMLARQPAAMYRNGAATTRAERTIARIWNITLDRITDLQPQAANLLCTLAWYAPDPIPTTLLPEDPADSPALNKALGLLIAYSMINPDPVTGTLAVHRLVQALARTPDPDDPHRSGDRIDQAREQATKCLSTALPATPDAPGTWSTWRMLLPHVTALTQHSTPSVDIVETARILNETALFLSNQGQSSQAISHLQRAFDSSTRVLGEDHPDTLASRNNLAGVYRAVGDFGRAIPLYEQTLTDRMRVLGEDHPDTLASRNNLAYVYQAVGDLARAIPLNEQTLTDFVRVLGEDHPNTLASRNNLAFAYQTVGDLGRAIPLNEQTLTDFVRVLGEDHPLTGTVRANLASALARSSEGAQPL